MSVITGDAPLHRHSGRWASRSACDSGRANQLKPVRESGNVVATRACADEGERLNFPWHRTISSDALLHTESCASSLTLPWGNLRNRIPPKSSAFTWDYKPGAELLIGEDRNFKPGGRISSVT